MRAELAQNYQIMTEYERMIAARAIAEESGALEGFITAGALAEWDASLAIFQAAAEKVKQERMREILSWPANELNEEEKHYRTQIAGILIDAEEPGHALEELRQEVLASNDRVKVRAFAEAMAGKARTHGLDLDTKLAVNQVAQNAGRDLAVVRETDAIKAARAVAGEAAKGITQAENGLFDAGYALGTVPPNGSHTGITQFEQARGRVVADKLGNISTILPKESNNGNGY